MNDREQIEELYRTYWQCMINKDIAGMDRIMADDYELRHITGLRQPKQDFFRSVTSGELNYYSAKHEEIIVKVSGETATMIGRSKVVAAVYGGGRNTWRLYWKQRLCLLQNIKSLHKHLPVGRIGEPLSFHFLKLVQTDCTDAEAGCLPLT